MITAEIVNGKLEAGEKSVSFSEVELTSGVILKKPTIEETKILDADETAIVEFSLKQDGKKLINAHAVPAKNDYVGDYDRGTVKYSEDCYNYSYHKVIVPDGAVIEERNFTQRKPNTLAIEGKNLTFIECNLVNNVIDPSWAVKDCNVSQIDLEAREAEEKEKALVDKAVIDGGLI
jgi:hypothetical protein